jgi:DNA-binding NarL/FixJ family response regulator
MLLFSFEKSTEEILLAFPKTSFYYSIPIICLLQRGIPHLPILKSGVTDCLEKPVTSSYLEAKIDSIFALINHYILTYHNDFENFRTSTRYFYKPDEFSLTTTEKKVLKLVLKGFSNRDIAGTIYISEGTVKNHLTRIYSKCSVKNRYELITLFSPY